MTPPPMRRPIELDRLDIETTLARWVSLAPIVELGITGLRQDMTDAGWRARTPEGDRTARPPRLTVRCKDCNTALAGSTGKDEHVDATGHANFEYLPKPDGMDPSCIDYADPTGELGLTLERLSEDLSDYEDAWLNVQKFMRRVIDLSAKHLPSSTPSVPVCTYAGCESPVESNGSGGYRGLEQINGAWVQRPGVRALCARHRSATRRAA